jgi:membrane fusion protein, multidrug efflux system
LAINLQRTGFGAISFLKVEQAREKRQEEDAAALQAEAGFLHAKAAEQQAIAALASAQSGVLQATAPAKQAASALQIAGSNVPGIAAQLDEARFNLAQCKKTAPSDGYVVN